MSTTNIKFRVHFARTEADLPSTLEKGVLYFVANQASVYNKDLPFSGINRVTSVTNENGVTTLNFNDNYGTDGNHLSVSFLDASLISLLQDHTESIKQLKIVNHVVFNAATFDPNRTNWTLSDVLNYIYSYSLQGAQFEYKSAGIIYTDNGKTHYFVYNGEDIANFYNSIYWDEVQIGNNQEVIHVESITDLPSIGNKSKLYIVQDNQELYRWDTQSLTYKICGFDPNNIKYINANF